MLKFSEPYANKNSENLLEECIKIYKTTEVSVEKKKKLVLSLI